MHDGGPRAAGRPCSASRTQLSTLNSEPRGLTLIEVLIVLVVISISLSLAVVSIRDWSVHSRLDGAARRVVQALRFAQGQAMVTGDDAAVEFDVDSDSLRCVRSVGSPPYESLQDPMTKRPYQVDLADASDGGGVDVSSAGFAGDAGVTFSKTGQPSSGGSVVLEYSGNTRTITVAPVSGRIDVQ
jgi:prepilin-type N-terminal cleavage/methylation domain-containing protein